MDNSENAGTLLPEHDNKIKCSGISYENAANAHRNAAKPNGNAAGTRDESFMRLVLTLAEKGMGHTSPNPMVGSVIVKDGRIIGQGYHKRYGEPHAERNALASCTEDPSGATMYVTLEPCCHYGKQPPCTDAIISAGISRVVTGSGDPNPLVAGKGVSILREHGIEVTEHVLKKECDALNEVFFHYITRKKPFVVMKYAMTLDGKIAAHTGNSKWVTGEEARNNVQADRGRYSAIMAGIGTVLKDDPLLTCRIPGRRNPVRIICDSSLRTSLKSRIAATIPEARTIIATCCNDDDLIRTYSDAGFEIIKVNRTDGHLDLNELMDRLYELKIDSILLEGGGRLNWSALKAGIVDKVQAYIAPKLFGGENAKTPVEGEGVSDPAGAFRLKDIAIRHFGEDLLIEGYTVCLQE